METKTLEITREKLSAIVEFDTEISERHDEKSSLIAIIESVAAYSTDTSKKDLQDAINELSVEEKRELSAIIWLGRSDYANFEAAYEHAKGFDKDAAAAHYFEGIAEYIPAGITLAEKEGIKIN